MQKRFDNIIKDLNLSTYNFGGDRTKKMSEERQNEVFNKSLPEIKSEDEKVYNIVISKLNHIENITDKIKLAIEILEKHN